MSSASAAFSLPHLLSSSCLPISPSLGCSLSFFPALRSINLSSPADCCASPSLIVSTKTNWLGRRQALSAMYACRGAMYVLREGNRASSASRSAREAGTHSNEEAGSTSSPDQHSGPSAIVSLACYGPSWATGIQVPVGIPRALRPYVSNSPRNTFFVPSGSSSSRGVSITHAPLKQVSLHMAFPSPAGGVSSS